MLKTQFTKRIMSALLGFGVSQIGWADSNPYATAVSGGSLSSSTANPLMMMQASPGGAQSNGISSVSKESLGVKEGPVYVVPAETVSSPAVPAPASQYVQPAPLVQPAQNLGRFSNTPSSTAPKTPALTSKSTVAAATPQSSAAPPPTLSVAAAKKFIHHDTGFNALYPILMSASTEDAMNKSFFYADYQNNLTKGTSSEIKNIMRPLNFVLTKTAQFYRGTDGVGINSALNQVVTMPFQDPNWMANLEGASADQVLKIIAVQGAVQNYLLNQILQREFEQTLLQTAQVRSVYDVIYAMELQEQSNVKRQKELLESLQAILVAEKKGGRSK